MILMFVWVRKWYGRFAPVLVSIFFCGFETVNSIFIFSVCENDRYSSLAD